MGTIADKLNYLKTTKGLIKNAIIDKGVDVSSSDSFRSYADKISQIESGGGKYAPSYISFYGYPNANFNYELLNFDTSNLTSLQYLFYQTQIKTLDFNNIGNFNTRNIINMNAMFSNSSLLTSVNLGNIDTSKVTSMQNMFSYCTNLTSVNLGNIDTSKVTSMASMFTNCYGNLTSLDLSNFNTSNVTTMVNMFYLCQKLTYLDISNFDFTKVRNYSGMFSYIPNNCEILVKDETAKNWIETRFSSLTNVRIKE